MCCIWVLDVNVTFNSLFCVKCTGLPHAFMGQVYISTLHVVPDMSIQTSLFCSLSDTFTSNSNHLSKLCSLFRRHGGHDTSIARIWSHKGFLKELRTKTASTLHSCPFSQSIALFDKFYSQLLPETCWCLVPSCANTVNFRKSMHDSDSAQGQLNTT